MFNRVLLKELRIKRHMTQVDVAGAVGISQPYFNRVERGIYVPSLKNMESIAKALGCSAKDLISE